MAFKDLTLYQLWRQMMRAWWWARIQRQIDISRFDKAKRYPLGMRHVDRSGTPWIYVKKVKATDCFSETPHHREWIRLSEISTW